MPFAVKWTGLPGGCGPTSATRNSLPNCSRSSESPGARERRVRGDRRFSAPG
ncbi:hypothetical protein ACFFX0_19715 [Citricoccus parietis]|uniref:Uncharacterized protein n=1 Tax=Citricoccus parietis TaxID=592307 RepID=A0ABV5G300_9MICC